MTDFNFIDTYQEAEDEGFGPSVKLPEGKFDAEIKVAEVGETRDGAFKASFMFANDDGVAWMNQSLASEKAKPFFAKVMQALGITGAMLSADPEAAVKTAIGQRWNITIKQSKTNGDFFNVYLNRRLNGDDASAGAGTSSPTPAAPPATPSPSTQGNWDI